MVHLMIVGVEEVVHVPQAPEEGMAQVHLGEEVVEDHHADAEGVQDLKIKTREALLLLKLFLLEMGCYCLFLSLFSFSKMKEDTGSTITFLSKINLPISGPPGGCKSPGFAHGGALELLGGGGGGSPAPGGNVTGVLISGLGAGGSGVGAGPGAGAAQGGGPGDGGRPEDGAGPGGGGRS